MMGERLLNNLAQLDRFENMCLFLMFSPVIIIAAWLLDEFVFSKEK